MREILEQYLTEKQNGYLQRGSLWEVVTIKELTVYEMSYLGQFATQTIETWWANSSTGHILMDMKNSFPIATHSFPVFT